MLTATLTSQPAQLIVITRTTNTTNTTKDQTNRIKTKLFFTENLERERNEISVLYCSQRDPHHCLPCETRTECILDHNIDSSVFLLLIFERRETKRPQAGQDTGIPQRHRRLVYGVKNYWSPIKYLSSRNIFSAKLVGKTEEKMHQMKVNFIFR